MADLCKLNCREATPTKGACSFERAPGTGDELADNGPQFDGEKDQECGTTNERCGTPPHQFT